MTEQLMYSEKDIQTIKSVFTENDVLLVAIRKLFFGATLTGEEKDMIRSAFSNSAVVEAFRRKVYSINNLGTPIGQLSDFWLGTESQVFGSNPDTIKQALLSKELVLQMFTKSFDLLTNVDGEQVSVDVVVDTENDPLGIKLIARNLYMKAIETALLAMKTIAGTKTETAEQAIKRLTKDSSK